MTGRRPVQNVGSRKARTLLALLGTRQGRVVGVDTIVEALWNDPPPRRPEAGVATLVSRLRARFGAAAVVGGRAGYRLGETVGVDLHEAAELVAEAETLLRDGEASLCAVAAESGLALLDGGPALAEYSAELDWAERTRDMQARLLRRARVTVAEAALRTGEPERACPPAEAAIAADPLDEAACRLLMRACFALGEPAQALLAYERLRRTLAVELGTDPALATQELYFAVLREHHT